MRKFANFSACWAGKKIEKACNRRPDFLKGRVEDRVAGATPQQAYWGVASLCPSHPTARGRGPDHSI
jgi:hypothetical protein